MAIVSFTNAQLAFGHFAMLDHADFSLEPGERVGLIGRNGTGKSSMLRIIAGQSKLDDGLLVAQQGIKVAYVEQEPQFTTRSIGVRCCRWRAGGYTNHAGGIRYP